MRSIAGGSFFQRWGEEILAGVAGGLLMALSFPPYPTRILCCVALVPLLRYFLRVFPRHAGSAGALRRGFIAAYVYGIVFFAVLLYWVANLIPESQVNFGWILIPGLILLVLYLALYPGLVGLALAFLLRRVGRGGLLAAPAVWGLAELLRSRGELAFSWGIIASALAPYPAAMQVLALAGPFGMGMAVVSVNVLLAVVLFGGSSRKRAAAAAICAVLVAAALGGGAARIRRIDAWMKAHPVRADVAIVQPNVDLGMKWKIQYRDSVFTQIEEYTGMASALGARLVIFPETAAPVSISHHPEYRNWLKRIAREAGVDLYIGYVRHERVGEAWRSFNSSGLFDHNGLLTAQYDKVNLLQFGERIPFSQYMPFLERMDFGQANFKPGAEATLFDSVRGRFGALICFESTFSGFTRGYVLGGADFLVNITNDGWFGSPRGPLQHSETAILRAVENGVTILRAANTGVSMYIDPAGRVVDLIGLDREGLLLVPVYPPRGATLYGRFGHAIFLCMAAASLCAAFLYRTVFGR